MRAASAVRRRILSARYVGSARHARVDGGGLLHHSLDGEAFAHPREPGLAELLTEAFVLECPHDRARERCGIARLDKKTGDAILDDFGDAAGASGDDWTRAGHRVEERRAETFGDGAHDEQIEPLETAEDIDPEARQQHVLLEVMLPHLPLEVVAQIAFT